jgi:hypothetical protein
MVCLMFDSRENYIVNFECECLMSALGAGGVTDFLSAPGHKVSGETDRFCGGVDGFQDYSVL